MRHVVKRSLPVCLAVTACSFFAPASHAQAVAHADAAGGDAATPAQAPARETLFVSAERVITRPGDELENAQVIVRDGKIASVGQGLVKPDGARELKAKVLCAAFIDVWVGADESPDPIADASASAATRAIDAFDDLSGDHARREALRSGVTCVRVQSSLNAKVAGMGAIVRVAPGLPADERVLSAESDVSMSIGLSTVQAQQFQDDDTGGSGAAVGGQRRMDPFDRIAELDRVIAAVESGKNYLDAQIEYQHEHEAWKKKIAEKEAELEKDAKKAKKDREKEQKEAEEKSKEFKEKKYTEDKQPQPPRYNEDNAVMARVANGEMPLIVQAHRAAEIRGLLEGTQKLDRLRLILAGATEAESCARELAERGVPVLIRPSLRGKGVPDELEGSDLALAGRLSRDGVAILVGSAGTGTMASRDLALLAAVAAGNGLDAQHAFDAVTLQAARALDVADRIGSVERGKDAELVLLDGDPLAPTTTVQYVISSGRLVVTPED